MTRARFTSNYPNDWVSVKDPRFWVKSDLTSYLKRKS